MRILHFVYLAFAPLAACLQVAIAQPAGTQQPPELPKATLTLSAATDTVRVGSPIKIKLSLKNTWDREIVFGVDHADVIAAVVVKDSNGDLAPETRKGYHLNPHWEHKAPHSPPPEPANGEFAGGSSALGHLKVGESWDPIQDVSMLYNLTKPGKYTIQMQKLIGPPEAPRVFTPVRSNILTITVTE